MTHIPEGDLRRITSSAALMTSDADGEALNAARAVCRLLGKHDLRVSEVIQKAFASPAAPPTSTSVQPWEQPNREPVNPWRPSPREHEVDLRTKHQAWVRLCLANARFLNEREIDFLASILDRRGLSEKQNAWLEAIKKKVGRAQK